MGCRELQVNDYFRMTDSASGMDAPYYALAGANKNITEYFDSNGNVVAHYEYSPFGKITVSNGAMADDFDYRFSSEYADDESGLVYYNYRYYSPELGRWLSRDPIGEEGGVNLYAMVGNDLINNWDMNGTILGFECCDGKWYWQVISCCRDGEIKSKFSTEGTGVFLCGGKIDKYYHWWIESAYGNIDFGPILVEGEDITDVFGTGITGTYTNASEYIGKGTCGEIKLNPCTRDIKKFISKFTELVKQKIGTKTKYNLVFDCKVAADRIIAESEKAAISIAD